MTTGAIGFGEPPPPLGAQDGPTGARNTRKDTRVRTGGSMLMTGTNDGKPCGVNPDVRKFPASRDSPCVGSGPGHHHYGPFHVPRPEARQ